MKNLATTMLIGLATCLPMGHFLIPRAARLQRIQADHTVRTSYGERVRVIKSFDADWRFLKRDEPGAEKPGFVDDSWRRLNVPHDWSIEGPFDEHNPAGGAGAFLPAGTGWYRKHFTVPSTYNGRRMFIEFDGVMANSDVWINGLHLGKRPYGYVSFSYELTGHLNFGDKLNVLAVRADDSAQPASRWYCGAGIFRHVRLVVTDPVHIEQWGTFVTTPKIVGSQATVHIISTVVNQSDTAGEVALRFTVVGPGGRPAGGAQTKTQTIAAGRSIDFSGDILVSNPELWDIDHPVLYRVVVAAVLGGKTTIDEDITNFGIREFHFDAVTGFWLNGKNFKLKGVCLHHDAGALGAAVPLRSWERRLVLLKQIGVNAVRTAHNPPAPEFLDLCDRLGLLVMDEMFDCWTVAKNASDYHLYFNEWARIDARDTVRRDRNHPSIVLYSAGNEIRDTPNSELAKWILKGLVDVFHRYDPTRPVTQALFRPNVSHDYDDGLADLLDVIGTNYRDEELLAAHRARPERRIVGTEQGHDLRTWLLCRDNPSYSGQFLWTGIDYMGESRRWPVVAAGSGLLDRTGTIKPMAYERESWWAQQPVVHIVRRVEQARTTAADPGFEPLTRRQSQFADWTPKSTDLHNENVEAYSNCDEVELILNGKSLGSRSDNANGSPRKWTVPYEPGLIKAIARNHGQAVAVDQLRTAGKPARVVLTADRLRLAPDWDDVSYVTASVADRDGVLIPDFEDLITFRITGPGLIAAVDNGDNSTHQPFQATERHAFKGRCVAIIRARAASGRITISASAPGLAGSSVSLETVAMLEEKR